MRGSEGRAPDFRALALEQSHFEVKTRHSRRRRVGLPSAPAPLTSQSGAQRHRSALHIIFSTDCTAAQDWQSLVLFSSASQVGQPGLITRIASGCNDTRRLELAELYARLSPRYRVHVTPDFSHDIRSKKVFKYYNKPFGTRHWLEHADPPVSSGTMVVLLDPDMILLEPITAQIKVKSNILHVKRGQPVSQPCASQL